MTINKPHHRRVRWKVRRAAEGWFPVVLIGEEPIVLAALPSKGLAKEAAKRRAELVKGEFVR